MHYSPHALMLGSRVQAAEDARAQGLTVQQIDTRARLAEASQQTEFLGKLVLYGAVGLGLFFLWKRLS